MIAERILVAMALVGAGVWMGDWYARASAPQFECEAGVVEIRRDGDGGVVCRYAIVHPRNTMQKPARRKA